MGDFMGHRSGKEPSSTAESLDAVQEFFNLDNKEEFRSISVPSFHRENPSGYLINKKSDSPKEEIVNGFTPTTGPRLKQNWIFTHGFGEKVMADTGLMIRCTIQNCDRLYRSVNGSTSSIRNHLKRKHGIDGPVGSAEILESPIISSVPSITPQPKKINSPQPANPPQSVQVLPKPAIHKPKNPYVPLEVFGESQIPLTVLQDSRLLQFIGTSIPSNSQINISAITGVVNEDAGIQVQLYKSKIREIMRRQTGVSLTLGKYCGERGQNQIMVTAHFIDNDWKPKELLLKLLDTTATTNFEHAHKLFTMLEEFGMTAVFHTITTDYSTDMCIIVQELAKLCHSKNIRFNPTEQHLPCLGYIINSTVNSVLKINLGPSSGEMNTPHYHGKSSISEHLDKMRMGIGAIKNTFDKLSHFQSCFLKSSTKYRELILDSPNQWDTTYAMIEALLEVKQAYNETCYSSDLSKFAITPEDIEFLDETKNFLGPFHAFSIRVSGTRYPTINRAVVMFDKLLSYLASIAPHKQSFFQKAYFYVHQTFRNFFGKNANIPLYPIASAMDPRLKYSFWKPPSCSSEDRERFVTMVTNYWEKNCKATEEIAMVPHYPPSSFDNIFEMEPSHSSDDLGRYIQESASSSSFNNEGPVWDYWRQSAHSFPQLSKMARKFLCIPVTSLPCGQQLIHSGKYAAPSLSKDCSGLVSNDMCILLSWKSTLG